MFPHSSHNGYAALVERLGRFPEGAPPSELLGKILAQIFSEREAGFLAQLPMRPFSSAGAAYLWGMREVEASRLLEGLAARALLLDIEQENGEKMYQLPAPFSGFLKFAMLRKRTNLDQEALSELLQQYLRVDGAYLGEYLACGRLRNARVLVGEGEITAAQGTRVLDYERASAVIRQASRIAVGTCACRHRTSYSGSTCSAPLEVCMTFGNAAQSLIRHGNAREISVTECLDLLQQAREHNLVQVAENVQDGVGFICNCCSCCCERLAATRKFNSQHPLHTSNFQARIKRDRCTGCGRCVDVCPAEAIGLISAHDPTHKWQRRAVLAPARCLGCGVCVRACKDEALALAPRPDRVDTPVDASHLTLQMALERGKLQHLIWDNQILFSHRLLAAVMGALFRLAAVKNALSDSQLGTRFLEAILRSNTLRIDREIARLREQVRGRGISSFSGG
jgi:NAD-dependent dihydropyrimidine dehydrogenase PreA subunit